MMPAVYHVQRLSIGANPVRINHKHFDFLEHLFDRLKFLRRADLHKKSLDFTSLLHWIALGPRSQLIYWQFEALIKLEKSFSGFVVRSFVANRRQIAAQANTSTTLPDVYLVDLIT